MNELTNKLIQVQNDLHAPKNQTNAFAGYKYRNCEDICEAVKPLLKEQGLLLTISDTMELIGERYYIKATCTITDGTDTIQSTAFARESDSKKGLDSSQVTGSTSSYARKYALNALFLIDDVKDADTMDNSAKPQATEPMATQAQVKIITEKLTEERMEKMLATYKIKTVAELTLKQASQILKGLEKEGKK